MSDIRAWLEELDLGDFAERFEAEKIKLSDLPHLTESDLEGLGLALGPRRRALAAIVELTPRHTTTPSAGAEAAPEKTPEAERRQLTVMFCDLVGSTALSEKLDPEDLREVMRAYQDACAGAIGRFEGHIAQTLGDGLMVYFGYPVAHEDDAQRAVRAGLDIIGSIKDLSGQLTADRGVVLDVRVGIHTGLVVAGEVGGADTRGDMAVIGDTPNIAARVESLAAPGTVLVGDRTRRLVGHVFEFEEMGTHDLKGLSVPMALYQAKSERAADSRFEAMHIEGLTPFVGRDEEIGILLGRWNLAKGGEGQVVLLEGEPGIGKSRITNTLRELIAKDNHTRLQYQCSPFHTNSALHPIITRMERGAGFVTDDDNEAKLDKLEGLIATDDQAELALIASLLSLPVSRYSALELSPQKQKERTIEVLVDQVVKLARESPVLLVFEDVHWIDPTSLEMLDLLIAANENQPILAVITFRPEFVPHWTPHSHVTLHSLNRLGKRQSSLLIERVAGKPIPDALIDQIIIKTDGIPLFIEELTKAVIESEIVIDADDHYELTGAMDSLAIPDTLHDSLMARLDKLIPVKEVAQVGAAIGREFSHQLIALLAPMSEGELNDALDKLITSELIFRRGAAPEAIYSFKHALVQDAAYDSMLKRDRLKLHKQIAEALLDNFPDLAETEPELLAHHYTAAGMTADAVPKWLAAGQASIGRVAFAEAIGHLTIALEQVESLPVSRDGDRLTLDIRSNLGTAYLSAKGWAAPELGEIFEPALGLCRKLGATEQLWPTLFFLWSFHVTRAEFSDCAKYTREFLDLADGDNGSDYAMIGHWCGLIENLWQGNYVQALEHHKVIVEFYDVERHGHIVHALGNDPFSVTAPCGSYTLWALGWPDQAVAFCYRDFDHSHRLNHPFNLTWTLITNTHTLALRREREPAVDWIEEATQIAREQSLGMVENIMIPGATAFLQTQTGDSQGMAQKMRDANELWEKSGGRAIVSLNKVIIAQALHNDGEIVEGLQEIDDALALINRYDERQVEAEAYRIKGQLLLKQHDAAEAETCFLKAIEIAQSQQAKSWELRAAISLAELWKHRNKTQEAYSLLSSVYDWFTEGFDTGDLKAAKALLDELR